MEEQLQCVKNLRGGYTLFFFFDLGVSIVMGVPHGWMVYKGKSQSKMDDDWGTPILGNLHFDGTNSGTLT